MTPLSIDTKDLTVLGPDRAVKFFRKLLWNEAGRINIGKDLINVPECINVGDGGIDAKIEDVSHSFNDSFIKQGITGYQIKAGDLSPQECKKELHEKEDLDEPLKPEVKRLLDEGGRYVLVLFADITNRKFKNRTQALKEEFKRLGYLNEPEVLSATKISNLAEQFPGLSIWLNQSGVNCLTYNTWATNNDILIPDTYVKDEQRNSIISEIRDFIRDSNRTNRLIRVVGLPGIGKTRLVYESLSPDDLKSKVIYTKANSFIGSNTFGLLQNNPNYDVILVVDECDIAQHEELYRSLSSKKSIRAIITMSYDFGQVNGLTNLFSLDQLSKDKIKELIQNETQSLDSLAVERISQFADGYPRIATLLVDSYLKKPSSKTEYIKFDDEHLIKRLIGGSVINGSIFRKNLKVLRVLSIFTKIGFKDEASKEVKWLAKYSNVGLSDIKEVAHRQRERGIVQGEFYIYVTPYLLRTHLFKEWWTIQDFNKDGFEDFVSEIPESLRGDLFQRFIEQIPFIGDNERGKKFVESLLRKDGIFEDPAFLKSQLGSTFFLKITEANPEAALNYLIRTVYDWNDKRIRDFGRYRNNLVWSLKRIAIWENLFTGAAKVLIKFVETDEGNYSNSATGVLKDLFSLGYGQMASSEAPPSERLKVLKDLINSESRKRRRIAYKTCDSALNTRFTKSIGAEYQGLRREPKLWQPETYGEIYDAYRNIWNLLKEKLGDVGEDEKKEIAEILVSKAQELNRISALSTTIIDTLDKIRHLKVVNDSKLLETISQILHYDQEKMSEEIIEKWKELKDRILGEGYEAKLKRYVGINLIEDLYDDEGKYNEEALNKKIERLAIQASKDTKLLEKNLDWLVSEDVNRGSVFGYYLEKNQGIENLDRIIDAQERSSSNNYGLISGFLKGVFEDDIDKWEQVILDLLERPKWLENIPNIVRNTGISHRVSKRLRNLVENDTLKIERISSLQFSPLINQLGPREVNKWIKTFINEIKSSQSYSIALKFLDTNYLLHGKDNHELPHDLTFQVLTSDFLLKCYDPQIRDQMVSYSWKRVSRRFLEIYPNDSIKIADKIIETYGEDESIFDRIQSESGQVLKDILNKYPEEVWELMSQRLTPPLDSKNYSLSKWMRGGAIRSKGKAPIELIPPNKLFEWVDENIEKRAWFLATFVPPKLFNKDSEKCLVRQLLIKYGDREDVRRNLNSNFSTGGWTGPESNYLSKQIKGLETYLEDEADPNVVSWVENRLETLKERMRSATIKEERRGY